ncbi:MAG: hypothetical protein IKO14_02010 [Oscillibacter sp.]|nr:hypothetical protein [Oscillibacter sp.]
MSVFRKLLFLLALLLLTGCAMFLLGEKRFLSLSSVIRDGWDDTRYEAVSAGAGDTSAAATLDGDTLRLVCFTPQGEKLGERSVKLPNQDGGTVAALYCFQKDLLFAAVYDLNAHFLSFYRLPEAGEAEALFRESCIGLTYDQRRSGTQILGISQDGDRISIAFLKKGVLQSYSCPARSGGLKENELPATNLDLLSGEAFSGAVLPDGALAVGGNGLLLINGHETPAASRGQLVTRLTRRNVGLYFVDASNLTVWYSDLAGTEARQLLDLADIVKGHSVTDLSIGITGEILLLLDGKTLVVAGEDGSRELKDILYPGRAACAGLLAVYAVTALGVVLLVWYALAQSQTALAFYWGAVMVAMTLAALLILEYTAVRPTEERLGVESNRNTMEAVVRLALRGRSLNDPYLCDDVSQVLASEERGNVTALVARLTAGGWYLPNGSRAELSAAFDVHMAGRAVRRGSDCSQEGKLFRYSLAQDDWAIFVTTNRSASQQLPAKSLFCSLVLLAAVAILILVRINRDVRLLAEKVEKVSAGGDAIKLRTGDELQSMASTLSGLSESIRKQMQERENVERAYRRFVPERVLNLLGKRTIEDVDKNTFTSGRMFVMKVRFAFPDYMYSGSADNRVLFNSINEVIERTASVAEQREGTVFNFAHDGYEVVMKRDSAELVSAAVSMAQEVISLNAARVERDLPEVTFRIALDVGNVMIGIVGDSEQMEPTTISSSFSTVRTLIRLAEQLEAGILCTEAIAGGAKGYGSRYLGKASGETPQRVYEIFDADEYGVRKGKAATVKRFSQGLFALYSGDRAEAKHIFLELAHDYPKDGAVRYYLYLVDRMEANPATPCALIPGKEL